MAQSTDHERERRAAFEKVLAQTRPKLHRFCSRMAGSVVDGEDIVQDVLIKAIGAYDSGAIENIESWLFRIAHNTAIDFLRRKKRQEALFTQEEPEMNMDKTASADARLVVSASLQTFMRLPVGQRGCVILMDVLGHSLQEVSETMDMSIGAVKAALHRGRARLRQLAKQNDEPPPTLGQEDLRRLLRYVDLFNARDFDSVRAMLADDVRLDLAARTKAEGRREVSQYFGNYTAVHDWRLVPGLVDRRPALLVVDPNDPTARPVYFIVIEWAGEEIAVIRDFRYARYAAESADITVLGGVAGNA